MTPERAQRLKDIFLENMELWDIKRYWLRVADELKSEKLSVLARPTDINDMITFVLDRSSGEIHADDVMVGKLWHSREWREGRVRDNRYTSFPVFSWVEAEAQKIGREQ